MIVFAQEDCSIRVEINNTYIYGNIIINNNINIIILHGSSVIITLTPSVSSIATTATTATLATALDPTQPWGWVGSRATRMQHPCAGAVAAATSTTYYK